MAKGTKTDAFMMYIAAVDKVAELAADPRATMPRDEPGYRAWNNEARVATRARDHYKKVWEDARG
jgi:hypothetical protein